MKYYRAYIVCGGKTKDKQYNRTIFVQTANKTAPASDVLSIIRKISFGRLITMKEIPHEEYIAGVSGKRGQYSS